MLDVEAGRAIEQTLKRISRKTADAILIGSDPTLLLRETENLPGCTQSEATGDLPVKGLPRLRRTHLLRLQRQGDRTTSGRLCKPDSKRGQSCRIAGRGDVKVRARDRYAGSACSGHRHTAGIRDARG